MKYYKTDSRKISFGEYWHISSGTGFIIGWLNKILGVPMNFISGIPEPQPLREIIIEASSVPPAVFEKLNPLVIDLKQLGFNQFWFYTSKNSLTAGFGYGVQALHPSQKTMGKIVYASYKAREICVLAFFSELSDETILATTNKKRDFNNPAKYTVQRLRDSNASRLWQAHQKKLATLGRSNPPKTFASLDEVAAFDNKAIQLSYDDKIARGIWVEMTDAEVEILRSKKLPPPIPSLNR